MIDQSSKQPLELPDSLTGNMHALLFLGIPNRLGCSTILILQLMANLLAWACAIPGQLQPPYPETNTPQKP